MVGSKKMKAGLRNGIVGSYHGTTWFLGISRRVLEGTKRPTEIA